MIGSNVTGCSGPMKFFIKIIGQKKRRNWRQLFAAATGPSAAGIFWPSSGCPGATRERCGAHPSDAFQLETKSINRHFSRPIVSDERSSWQQVVQLHPQTQTDRVQSGHLAIQQKKKENESYDSRCTSHRRPCPKSRPR